LAGRQTSPASGLRSPINGSVPGKKMVLQKSGGHQATTSFISLEIYFVDGLRLDHFGHEIN
jgi:hypothetical protein